MSINKLKSLKGGFVKISKNKNKQDDFYKPNNKKLNKNKRYVDNSIFEYKDDDIDEEYYDEYS